MTALDQVLAQHTGARFYRADLHVHCYEASHDVRDTSMTPKEVVNAAVREGLSLIAITDHNEIGGVSAAIKEAKDFGLYIVPGVELSTPQGHLLCYLPTLDALAKFYAGLSIADRGLSTSRCQHSILDCLGLVQRQGGFGILAHVDAPSGFEVAVPGYSPHKVDVLCHPALLGIELKSAASPISFADSDPNADRVRIGRERIKRLQLNSKQNLARVLNSDAHTLETLGRNAEQAKKVTRYKMGMPSFEALRLALEDADARVRIEDQIPQTVPRALGVYFGGGFLGGQAVHFSSNLNCIIGGRGTGKSTAFEAIRCLSADGSDSKVVDSEVWPDELHLFWQDAANQRHSLYRLKGESLENLEDADWGPRSFDIDCFGQGEAAKISLQAQSDPLALLGYLDRFVDLDDAHKAEEGAREQLLTLQTKIEEADQTVQRIPEFERLLATTRQQLAALQKPEVKELVALQRHIATEREIRADILARIRDAREDLTSASPKETVALIEDLADPETLTVGGAEFKAILEAARKFLSTAETAEKTVKEGLTVLEQLTNARFVGWKTKEAEAQKKVDAKKRELEALKVAFDMSYITKLAADEAKHAQQVKNLQAWKPHLAELRRKRAAALKSRWAARDRKATLRDAFGRQATATLGEALTDLHVSLKYSRSAYSPDAERMIIDALGWRTNQQPRAKPLVEDLTIPVLLEAIQRKDTKPILALADSDGLKIFRSDEAQVLLDRLGDAQVKYALERVAIHDLPRLQVRREVPDGQGGTRFVVRDFAKLSLGQQQSVLLALMLSSPTDRPLIIDQPEDNLDGEFIYKTLVPVLRRAKERRQIIIVTHNPNVAVLGDAELIVVMKAMSDRGEIVARGSIDDPATCEATCAILEGAREAFLRRAKIYGIRTV
jgi:energy-coupling factor transporter ATP-binding protein EcfA2/histidinol phosphatase-like PHP family hydrolase